MDINKIADQHYKWLQEMGWEHTPPLESLALITSEIGEAVNECRGPKPTSLFGIELADIILRTLGLARQEKIDITECIRLKMLANQEKGNYKKRLK